MFRTTLTATASSLLGKINLLARRASWLTTIQQREGIHISIITRRRTTCRLLSASASVSDVPLAERCDAHLVHSPYKEIPEPPYPPLFEFVTSQPHWKERKDKIAMVDGTTGMQRTFDDYWRTACGLAGALRHDYHINPRQQNHHNQEQHQTMIAMYCPNHVDYLPIVLAIAICGAQITPINPLFTAQELERLLNASQASIVMVHHSKVNVLLDTLAHDKCPLVKHAIVIPDDDHDNDSFTEGMVDLNSLRNHDKPIYQTQSSNTNSDDATPLVASNSQPFYVPYSSGTTGQPKGVILTPQNILANLWQVHHVEYPAFDSHHTLITPLPFFHIFAFTVAMLYPAWRGQTTITMSGRFELETFCQLVEKYKPHRALLVPPILVHLAKNPIVQQYDLSSLYCLVSGAAPLSHSTEQAVQQRIGHACVVKQSWGMSELSPVGCHNPDTNPRSGSVGPLVASTSAKIIDEQGRSLGPHQTGQLLIRGPQVMRGYLNAPEETANALSPNSNWLTTGDVASYDEDGYFYITDRLKELIKVRGYAVAPAELEALLLTNDAISDAAVIQVPDEASGELPRAFVVLKPEHQGQLSEQDIYEWFKQRVAPYKRLDGGIVFRESIPKSPSGKILRRILRDEINQENKD